MLKVIKSGFFTSIQDLGRFGFRSYGVPVSGAMDTYAFQFANVLLGNSKEDAVLEMTMTGGEFRFTKPTYIAIAGAPMKAELNNVPIEYNRIIEIKTDDILCFDRATLGVRTYLAVRGGFISEKVLGSRSQLKPITLIDKIKKGSSVDYNGINDKIEKSYASIQFDGSIFTKTDIEVFKGPEFEQLTMAHKSLLFSNDFKISKLNNRMAYQLEPLMANALSPILTSPVIPGTVQLTPMGNLIILMRDCQTTGGYPRILQLTRESINILAQKSTGQTINFRQKAY
jgi:biotin-dependent carboxylase-like uncharacterized protein